MFQPTESPSQGSISSLERVLFNSLNILIAKLKYLFGKPNIWAFSGTVSIDCFFPLFLGYHFFVHISQFFVGNWTVPSGNSENICSHLPRIFLLLLVIVVIVYLIFEVFFFLTNFVKAVLFFFSGHWNLCALALWSTNHWIKIS